MNWQFPQKKKKMGSGSKLEHRGKNLRLNWW